MAMFCQRRRRKRLAIGLLVPISCTYPFVIFDDVLADAGQRRPLAIVDGFDGAPFVRFELANFAAETVRRHT